MWSSHELSQSRMLLKYRYGQEMHTQPPSSPAGCSPGSGSSASPGTQRAQHHRLLSVPRHPFRNEGLHSVAFSIYNCMWPPHTQLAGTISGQPARSGFEVCALTWRSAGGRLPAATRALSSSSAPREKRWARCKGDGMGAPFPSGKGDQLLT